MGWGKELSRLFLAPLGFFFWCWTELEGGGGESGRKGNSCDGAKVPVLVTAVCWMSFCFLFAFLQLLCVFDKDVESRN
jgi:hypothetical protein